MNKTSRSIGPAVIVCAIFLVLSGERVASADGARVAASNPPPVAPATVSTSTGPADLSLINFKSATCAQQLSSIENNVGLGIAISNTVTAGLNVVASGISVAGDAIGIGTDQASAADIVGIVGDSLGLVSNIGAAATAATGLQLQRLQNWGNNLPSCDSQFTGTVTVGAGGVNVSGDSIFNNSLGVAGNVDIGGSVTASQIASTQGISADGGAITLGDRNGHTYSAGITIGGGAVSGAGVGGTEAYTGAASAIAIGNGAQADTATSTAMGEDAIAAQNDSSAYGAGATATGAGATATGVNASATGSDSTAMGLEAAAAGLDSLATGYGARALGSESTATGAFAIASGGDPATAVGYAALASGDNSTAVGANSEATQNNSTAVGDGARALTVGSSAFGQGATAMYNGPGTAISPNVAVGNEAVASGENSDAFGSHAVASAQNSVAIGNYSTATRPDTVSFGSPGHDRQLVNVAPGTEATDAVNFAQLQGMRGGLVRQINQTGAMDAAMSQIDVPKGYRFGLGAGVGAQGRQAAAAIGIVAAPWKSVRFKLSAAYGGNRANIAAGFAIGLP